MLKKTFRPLLVLSGLVVVLSMSVMAQTSRDGVWQEVKESKTAFRSTERHIIPSEYRTFRLNKAMLSTILATAPGEDANRFGVSNTIITLPMPDGSFERFRIQHAPIVAPELLEKYPELGLTFNGQGIDDPTATVRLDMMPSGFHSMIFSERGTMMVDPYAHGETAHYISYFKRNVEKPDFKCEFETQRSLDSLSKPRKADFHEFLPDAPSAPAVISGTQLRTYRLALAATNEYAVAVGGNTVAGTLAAQTTVMNRVNGIYERDLAIRMVIIGNNDQLIYSGDRQCGGVACTAANDPYTNNNGLTMLTENINNTDTVIGSANYDMGHVFSTGGGGVAGLGVVCGAQKARGVTGLSNPVGDVFAIDYVAHEMGHQWGAEHTFNGGSGSCSGGNRAPNSAYEPGSGITIMGYAGICGAQNLAATSIDSFHVKSLEDIVAFSQTGAGNGCAAPSATGNTPPTVSSPGGTSFNIPMQTPFTLTAASSDPNGDTVTYDWQQYDLGGGTTAVPNTDSDGNARPIFRPFGPVSSPSRTFPQFQHILNTANIPPNTTGGFLTGELLPQIARTMNFQVIARDNRANGGGINTATVTVNVAATGPFRVSSPNTNITWFLNSNPVVTWEVGGSNGAPINAANVRILLSTDGGQTFPIVLANSTPNDGSETVTSPALNSNSARVRVEAIDNIFFDISDTNFTISNVPAANGALGGRIVTPGGRGVARIYVLLVGPSTNRIAMTNTFGYFNFDQVGFGSSYTITPQPRKGTSFTPANIVRDHNAAATDVNFTTN
ncbi:MAG TPA: M12 family metallo-peptidase [Pyrinomonadaceae bacterium]|nr:M12 family metallo-peptidase [Pyrinomonadaceae bacterium]